MSHSTGPHSPVHLCFGSDDQGRFLLKRPQTSPSNQRILLHMSLTTQLSSTNQNPGIIQTFNCRNHERFQLIDIFCFTSQSTRLHTFLLQSLYLIFCYPNVKTLFNFLLLHTLLITHMNTTVLGNQF